MARPLRGYGLVFVGAASYGVVSSLVKLAYDEGFRAAPIATSQALAGLLGLVLGLVCVRLFGGRPVALPSPREAWPTLAVGATTGVTAILYYRALETIAASVAIVLLFQFTWMGLVAEAFLRRAMPSRKSLVAVVLAWLGTVLAAGVFDAGHVAMAPMGVALGLGAGVSYTIFVVGSSRVGHGIDPLVRGTLFALGAVIVLGCAFGPGIAASPSSMGLAIVPWSLALGFFGVLVPNVAFAMGAPIIGGERASVIAAVELPVAVMAAHFGLGEPVSIRSLAGVALILVASGLPVLDEVSAAER